MIFPLLASYRRFRRKLGNPVRLLYVRLLGYSEPSFSIATWKRGGVWMSKLGVISRERLKLDVKLLLSANRKSYMPRRSAQQRMTLSDLEWPFHIIRIARYLCGS